MHKRIPLFTLLILMFAINANATSPCHSPTKEWFTENVIKKSDLVVYATINDYSNEKDYQRGWTKIDVIEVLKGRFTDKQLTITNWQAVFEPLYDNQKGSYAIIWLKTQDYKYYITDLSWDACVPSIWGADINKSITSKIDNSQISFDDIKKLIDDGSKK